MLKVKKRNFKNFNFKNDCIEFRLNCLNTINGKLQKTQYISSINFWLKFYKTSNINEEEFGEFYNYFLNHWYWKF